MTTTPQTPSPNPKIYLCRHGNTFGPGDKVIWVGSGEDLPLVEKGRQQAVTMAERLQEDGVSPVLMVSASLKRTKEYAEIIQDVWGRGTGHEGVESNQSSLVPNPPCLTSPLTIDPRLNEVSYGNWGGKTTEEIVAQYGEQVLHDWDNGIVPKNAGWSETEEEIRARLAAAWEEVVQQAASLGYSWGEGLGTGHVGDDSSPLAPGSQMDIDESNTSCPPRASCLAPRPAIIIVTSNGIIRLLLERLDPAQYAQKKAAGTLKVPTGGFVVVEPDAMVAEGER